MIKVQIDFDKAVDKQVKDLERGEFRLRILLRKALREAGVHMLRSVNQNFRAGGRPSWPALAQSTVANRKFRRRARRGSSHNPRPLQDTGRLKNSISMLMRSTEVSIGTNVEYAKIHQFGGTIHVPKIVPRKKKALRFVTAGGNVVFSKSTKPHTVNIPQRAFLMFQPRDIRIIERIFDNHFGKAFGLKFGGREV